MIEGIRNFLGFNHYRRSTVYEVPEDIPLDERIHPKMSDEEIWKNIGDHIHAHAPFWLMNLQKQAEKGELYEDNFPPGSPYNNRPTANGIVIGAGMYPIAYEVGHAIGHGFSKLLGH